MSPMRREAYPADWEAISLAVRESAGWKCQTCGAPGGKWISRRTSNPFEWRLTDHETWNDGDNWSDPVRVILTVHHRGVPYPDGRPGDPHDKMDVRPENLFCLCQRCHWIEDLPIHIEKGKLARYARKLAAGQQELWP